MDAPNDPSRTPDREVIGRVGPSGPPPRVLIVSDRAAWSRRLRLALQERSLHCDAVRSMNLARLLLGIPPEHTADRAGSAHAQAHPGAGATFPPSAGVHSAAQHVYDAVVSDCALPDGDGLAFAAAASERHTPVILVAKRASIDLASCAIACGAADLVERRADAVSDLAARIWALADRSRNQRAARSDQPRRLFRLRGMLAPRNLPLNRQHDPDVSDLLLAHPELAETMKNVSTVSEFKGLIRGEFDIEQLLRTTLEFVLARSGPTNAAVFLPTTSGDYSLGAYVNYDCPKDTCDVLLDHLANAVAPRFEDLKCGDMAHLTDETSLDRYLGNDADWLRGSHVVGFPCIYEQECLAIFMLFRDGRSPYATPLLEQIKTVGELFAAQLARVIRIHHRHLPKHKWGMIGDPPAETDDYGDMAA